MGIDMKTAIVFTKSFKNHHFGPYIMIVYLNLIKSTMALWSEALIVPYTLWQMKDVLLHLIQLMIYSFII